MADAVWLASYPATYVGLALLLRERLRTWRATLWLDGVIGGLTAGAVGATLVFGPGAGRHGGRPGRRRRDARPPAGRPHPGALRRRRLRGARLAPRALVVAARAGARRDRGGRSALRLQDSTGAYFVGPWLDALWPAGSVAMAAATWQPAERRARRDDGWAMIVLPGVFALGALASSSPLTWREEAVSPEDALQLADARMYARSTAGAGTAPSRRATCPCRSSASAPPSCARA